MNMFNNLREPITSMPDEKVLIVAAMASVMLLRGAKGLNVIIGNVIRSLVQQ